MVEAVGRHDDCEVVVLCGRPPCVPVGSKVLAFALEELTSPLPRWSVEQDPYVEDVVQLGDEIEVRVDDSDEKGKVSLTPVGDAPEGAEAPDLIQGPNDVYEGNWLDDVLAVGGGERYYPPSEFAP